MIKEGTTFTICSRTELIGKGWILNPTGRHYTKDNFPGNSITNVMMNLHAGETLTVKSDTHQPSWYAVEENTYFWPVATFLVIDPEFWLNFHTCEEGQTPIDGWSICKHCGKNLKEIK